MRNLATLAALLTATSIAAAGPKADKKRPKPGKKLPDITAALASNDPVRICQAAIDLATAGDLPRAGLLLPRCPSADAIDPGDAAAKAMADAARRSRIAVRKAADADGWSPIEIALHSGDAATTAITIDQFPGITLAPGPINLPAGTYHVVARTRGGAFDYTLTVAEGNRALVMLDPPPPPAPAKDGVVDFGKDEPLPPPLSGPPPKVKHESLIPDRYLKGIRRTRGSSP